MQYKNNARNAYIRSYTGNGVENDWFFENLTLANRVTEKQPWNIKSPPGVGWGKRKEKRKGRKKEIKKKENEKYEG
jgi:hypothetical protein